MNPPLQSAKDSTCFRRMHITVLLHSTLEKPKKSKRKNLKKKKNSLQGTGDSINTTPALIALIAPLLSYSEDTLRERESTRSLNIKLYPWE